MRRLIDICLQYCERHGGELTCLGMPPGSREAIDRSNTEQPSFMTLQQGKVAFTRAAFTLASAKQCTIAVAGYLGVAPVAWLLMKAGLIRSYVVLLHGTEAWERVPLLNRMAARDASLVVSTTEHTARIFAEVNETDPARTRVLPLGLGDSSVEEIRRRSPSASCLRVLTVGRLVAIEGYKGVDTLIKAVAYARSRSCPMTLDVVGTGDDVPRLQRLCSHLRVEDAVTFHGAVGGEHLNILYRDCDVFAMPSKGEGFGIVFLEAMRWGKPCIGGNHGGIPEVIDEGVTGYLVEHGDHVALADRLSRFASDHQLLHAMGLQAQDKVSRMYLYPHLQERWFHLLDEVAELRGLSIGGRI